MLNISFGVAAFHGAPAATTLSDLAGAGNSLEALTADRLGQHAIRVSLKYRLCFVWSGRNAGDVEIVDYH
jgi:proteic killer suppression protein